MTENAAAATATAASTPEQIRAWLLERVGYYLEVPAASLDPRAPLADHGLDSVYAFALCGEIEDALRIEVEPTLIWDVESLAELADRIVELVAEHAAAEAGARPPGQ